MNKGFGREIFSEVIGDLTKIFDEVYGDVKVTEPINDYADPIVKARKHLHNLEHMLRLKLYADALEQLNLIKTQCIKLENYIYRENEK